MIGEHLAGARARVTEDRTNPASRRLVREGRCWVARGSNLGYGEGMVECWVLHADMDAFYASIEQRERPELIGKPAIVGASSARGVVAAASYEARRFGVRSAMPGFRARELCPNGVFLAGRMDLYVRVSKEVRRIFQEFTPLIEPLALDEAFLDISGSVHLYGGPRELASLLKTRVKQRLDLTVSVGVGPNKLAAKLACTLSKPDGLAIVEQDRLRGWLAPLPVRRLWGIGPVTAERLEAHGLSTIGELADAEPSALAAVLGNRAGRFQRLAQGIDEAPVDSERVAKSIGEENTFERDVIDPEVISGALSAHAEVVAARARAAGLAGRTVSLKVKLARRLPTGRSGRVTPWEPVYPVVQRSRTRSVPTDDGTEIREMALWLWRHAHIAEPIRLLGVTLSGLVPADSSGQLELFQGRGALGPTLDAITNRYGPGAIGRATEGLSKQTPSLKKRI